MYWRMQQSTSEQTRNNQIAPVVPSSVSGTLGGDAASSTSSGSGTLRGNAASSSAVLSESLLRGMTC